jgi:hypothetical protein
MFHAVEATHDVESLVDVGNAFINYVAGHDPHSIFLVNDEWQVSDLSVHRVGKIVDQQGTHAESRASWREQSYASAYVADGQSLRISPVESESDIESDASHISKLVCSHMRGIGPRNLPQHSLHHGSPSA